MSLVLPFADFSPYPRWDCWLVRSSDMSQITELEVHDKQLQKQLDNQESFTGWVHLLDDAALEIEEPSTAIRLDRNGETVYSGPVWKTEDSSQASGVGQQSGSDQCKISSFGWFNTLGGSGGTTGSNGRLVHTGAEFQAMIWADYPTNTVHTANYLAWRAQNNGVDYAQLGIDEATTLAYDAIEYPQTTDAAIIFDLLDRANIDSPTRITKGNIYGSPLQRNLTLQRFQVVGEEIQTLVNVEAGVDWRIDPVTRQMDLYGLGASTSPLISSGYGVDRGQGCLFSYPGNCISVTRSRDATRLQNRVEAIGQYSVGRSDDLASQAQYDLHEAQDSLSEVVDPNILTAYAVAETTVLSQPWTIITFTPRGLKVSDATTPGVPRPFDDYDLGDIVYAYVNRGRIQVGTAGSPQPVRVFGYTINISDDGVEKVSGIQTSYQGLGAGA